MLLKKLINLCKKEYRIELVTMGDTVFLSDGNVYGAFESGDTLTADEIMCFMELTDDQREAMQRYDKTSDEPIIREDLGRGRYSINCDGLPLQVFVSKQGAVFADSGYIQIFKDCPQKRYALGTFEDRIMIIVMRDTAVIGMIDPQRVDLDTMCAFCEGLAAQVRLARDNDFLCGGIHQYSLTDE